MDLLNPELEEVDGCYYRVNLVDGYSYGRNAETLPYRELDDGLANEYSNDSVQDEDEIPNLVQSNGGYFTVRLHAPRIYLPIIIGKRGSTQHRLEKETRSFIYIPRRNEHGDINIRSRQKEAVVTAYRRIQIMINTARRKQKCTHFISIPLTEPQIKNAFLSFKKLVLESFSSDRNICDELFQNPAKLHLTVDVMVLADNEERKLAIDTLYQCKKLFINPYRLNSPIKISVQGLEIMNDDPSEVRVLFGRIVTDDSLQKLADHVSNFLAKTELTHGKTDRVKLHATLMNAKFLSSKIGDVNGERHNSFDARNILKNFENYEFGEVTVDCLLLSQTNTTGRDGYYETSAEIDFY